MHIKKSSTNDDINQIVQQTNDDTNFVSKPVFYMSASIGGTIIIVLIVVIAVRRSNALHKKKYGILPSSHTRSDLFLPVHNNDTTVIIPDANKSRAIQSEGEGHPQSPLTFHESPDGFEVLQATGRQNEVTFSEEIVQFSDEVGYGFEVNNSFEGSTFSEWNESIEGGGKAGQERQQHQIGDVKDRNGERYDKPIIGDDLQKILSSSLVDLDSESDSDVFEDIDGNSVMSF